MDRAAVERMLGERLRVQEIADALGISRELLHKRLREWGIDRRPCVDCGKPAVKEGRAQALRCEPCRIKQTRRMGRDRELRRAFGIGIADYEAMVAAQGGACALCGRTFNKRHRTPHVDHDHDTGRVRGIVHHYCNSDILAGIEKLAHLRGEDFSATLEHLRQYLNA